MTTERVANPRRRRILTATGIAALVVLYVVVVVSYAFSSRPYVAEATTDVPADAIGITLRTEAVNAVGNRLAMTIDLTDRGPLDDGGSLSRPVTVAVTENDGPRIVDFASGTLTSAVSLSLMTAGFVELWPFDHYTVDTTVAAAQGSLSDLEWIPAHIAVTGGVPGWEIEAHTEMLGASVIVDGAEQQIPTLVITASRSAATVVFGIVLLSLMIVMPILVLVAAITVYRGRRKVEPALMSWTAAMLFATIPLRTFLPGSPPIGSWIDFVVVLWVIAGLIIGLVIYFAAWLRWSPKLHPQAQPTP